MTNNPSKLFDVYPVEQSTLHDLWANPGGDDQRFH